jgi:hypothetical protein
MAGFLSFFCKKKFIFFSSPKNFSFETAKLSGHQHKEQARLAYF